MTLCDEEIVFFGIEHTEEAKKQLSDLKEQIVSGKGEWIGKVAENLGITVPESICPSGSVDVISSVCDYSFTIDTTTKWDSNWEFWKYVLDARFPLVQYARKTECVEDDLFEICDPTGGDFYTEEYMVDIISDVIDDVEYFDSDLQLTAWFAEKFGAKVNSYDEAKAFAFDYIENPQNGCSRFIVAEFEHFEN